MEITRIGAKRFFCHSSVMWLNTESVPEAFPPPSLPLAVIISVSSHSLSSVTYYFSLCFISPFIASIFNMTHLRVSFYGVTRNLALCLSSVTRAFYLTFINSFILLKKKHPVSTLFFLSLSDGPSRSLSHSPFTLLSLGVLFKLFHSRCTLLWLCQTAHPPFVYVYLLYVFLYLNIHLSFTLTPFPSLFLLILPAFLDILRFRVALQSLTAPLWHWSFLDLRGAGSWKLSTGKREYIFALRLSQRHVIVK